VRAHNTAWRARE